MLYCFLLAIVLPIESTSQCFAMPGQALFTPQYTVPQFIKFIADNTYRPIYILCYKSRIQQHTTRHVIQYTLQFFFFNLSSLAVGKAIKLYLSNLPGICYNPPYNFHVLWGNTWFNYWLLNSTYNIYDTNLASLLVNFTSQNHLADAVPLLLLSYPPLKVHTFYLRYSNTL